MNITPKSMNEFVEQGWLQGELTGEEAVSEKLQRIGAHIYDDYRNGFLTYDVAERSLQSLNSCEDIWFGMPEIPHP